MPLSSLELTVIVPTRDEADNVEELILGLDSALRGIAAQILFIDDSRDDTCERARVAASRVEAPVRVVHRPAPIGGLSGAVIEGLRLADSPVCVVMDGDLQHPPAAVPKLLKRFRRGDVDVVVASRYLPQSASSGVAGWSRRFVSGVTKRIAKSLFPLRLRGCSDPMTGFFLVDRGGIDLDGLRPRGFKILLEILVRAEPRVAEIPFEFTKRGAGLSKASPRQAAQLVAQLFALRFRPSPRP